MYHSTGMKISDVDSMDRKPRYKVFARVAGRDISKYTNSEIEAQQILKELREAAAKLSLLDVFRGGGDL